MTDTSKATVEAMIERLEDGFYRPPEAFQETPPEWAKDPFNGDCAEKCGDCGGWCEVVRPGKTQCVCCDGTYDGGGIRLAAAALLRALQDERDAHEVKIKKQYFEIGFDHPSGRRVRAFFPTYQSYRDVLDAAQELAKWETAPRVISDSFDEEATPTHWRPLPTPPQDGE